MTGASNEVVISNLEIVLLKKTFILPWSQFLFAEGNSYEVRLVFSTHDVLVTGSRLEMLLQDLSAQRLSRLQEPVRAEMFSPTAGPQISSVSVQKVD
jgi:hypothetical protein